MKHLVFGDVAVAVQVVDPEAEFQSVAQIAAQKNVKTEYPRVEPYGTLGLAIPAAEHTLDQGVLGYYVERVVQQLAKDRSVDTLKKKIN